MADSFRCMLVTPEEQLFDEQVAQVTLPGWDGQIGLLVNRAPMLVKLGYGPLRLEQANGAARTWFVGGGFAQMRNNELTILTDEALPAGKLDVQEAKAALKEALALRGIGEPSMERRDRDLARARGMVAVAETTTAGEAR